MRAVAKMLLILSCALPAAAVGCADDDDAGGDGGSACPDVSGDYVIQEHCEPSLVGGTVTVGQEGCDLSADWGAGDPWAGAVDADGYATCTGGSTSTTLTCTGPVEEGVWTIDCTPGDCHVVLVKQ